MPATMEHLERESARDPRLPSRESGPGRVRGQLSSDRTRDHTAVDSPYFLSRLVGNDVVAAMAGRHGAMRVSRLDDAAEREAESMAATVAAGGIVRPAATASGLSRCPDDPGCACDHTLHRSSLDRARSPRSHGSDVGSIVSHPGRPLPGVLRRDFEQSLGADLGDVRIHDDAGAATSAASVRAAAYTVGSHVVFGAGHHAPGTTEGRRLLAHELIHVVQQRATGRTNVLYRQPQPGATPAPVRPARGTAASAPALDVRRSVNGPACACIVFVHNEEHNARLTAKQMHAHCSYNLAIISPDRPGQRKIRLPNGRVEDPNSLFDEAIAEECTRDEPACRAELVANAGSRDHGEIDRFVRIQFFLAIRDCSANFTIPVVALHNNAVTDTATYRRRLADIQASGGNVDDLRMDIDKTPGAGGPTVDDLRSRLTARGFDPVPVMDRAQRTSIFRWCRSDDLTKCHIGDPANPDRVVWTTNPEDFERLRRTNTNVVLQTSAAVGAESLGDLSTLFLVLRDQLNRRTQVVLDAIVRDTAVNVQELQDALADLERARQPGARQPAEDPLIRASQEILELTLDLLRFMIVEAVRNARLSRLRFVNIETPVTINPRRAGDERVENFRFILATLRALDLHCCNEDPAAAHGTRAIENVLNPLPPPPRR